MALFQKKQETSSAAPLYTLGAGRTVLIIGLGNPGKKYEGSRHNIGFEVIDHFAKQNEFPEWTVKKDLKCLFSVKNLGDNHVILCKPATFMNLSGEAAQAVQRFYRVYNKNTLALYDELSINFGQLRTRGGGADAGHNGVKSLIQHLGEDFGRLRVGVGPLPSAKTDPAAYVLGKFSKDEQKNLPLIIQEAGALITEYIFSAVLLPDTRSVL